MKCHYEGTGVFEGLCLGTKECDSCIGPERCTAFKAEYKTNADRIRSMRDEELAEFMAERYDREHTARILGELIGRGYTPDRTMRMALHEKVRMQWLDWLRQPVKDGDNE